MALNYNLDFDDDDEDEAELTLTINAQKPSTWQLQDIERLKEQTSALLDPKWKETRNQHLIHKMLELDQPTITVKMVDFLMQETVCETLVGFITQNFPDKTRPAPTDQFGEEMKLAYRAVLLLSPDMINDPLNAILTKKSGAIARKLFDIFRTDSCGSFYHAYRILEFLLRLYPLETFEGLTSDGMLEERMTNLLRYIGYPPVCELLVMLIALTPLPRSSPTYGHCAKARWAFLEAINAWNFMLNMTKVVTDPESHCICDSYVSADQHSTAAAQLLQDLTEKLSLEDTGDLLLLPYGHNSDLIDLLVTCVVDNAKDAGLRRSAAKLLSFLLRRAAESEIVCFVPNPSQPNLPPSPTYLPNRLYALRERIVVFIRNRMEELMNAIATYDGPATADGAEVSSSSAAAAGGSGGAKKYPQFGALRHLMVEVLVLMVESDETVASMISLDLFKALITWTLRYPHNNIYHAIFYRLIFAVLRQGQEAPQRLLFKKAKFALFLIDNFVPYIVDDNQRVLISEPIPKSAPQYELRSRRVAVRGLIMNCANAIRLQLTTEPAETSFLVHFFQEHDKWSEFLPQLTTATDLQLQFGLGLEVNQVDTRPAGGGEGAFMQGEGKPGPSELDMDVSTRFARSLGFYEEGRWSLDSSTTRSTLSADEDISADTLAQAANAARKERGPRRYSIEDSGGHFSYLADHDEPAPPSGDDSTTPPQPPDESD